MQATVRIVAGVRLDYHDFDRPAVVTKPKQLAVRLRLCCFERRRRVGIVVVVVVHLLVVLLPKAQVRRNRRHSLGDLAALLVKDLRHVC